MRWKAGSFSSTKIRKRKAENVSLSGITQPALFRVRGKRKMSLKPRVNLVLGDWLPEYTVLLVQRSTFAGAQSYLSFGLLTWCPRKEQLRIQSRDLFQ